MYVSTVDVLAFFPKQSLYAHNYVRTYIVKLKLRCGLLLLHVSSLRIRVWSVHGHTAPLMHFTVVHDSYVVVLRQCRVRNSLKITSMHVKSTFLSLVNIFNVRKEGFILGAYTYVCHLSLILEQNLSSLSFLCPYDIPTISDQCIISCKSL